MFKMNVVAREVISKLIQIIFDILMHCRDNVDFTLTNLVIFSFLVYSFYLIGYRCASGSYMVSQNAPRQ